MYALEINKVFEVSANEQGYIFVIYYCAETYVFVSITCSNIIRLIEEYSVE